MKYDESFIENMDGVTEYYENYDVILIQTNGLFDASIPKKNGKERGE
jgi:hypothetical protein